MYRLCNNYSQENICNWAIPADEPDTLCQSCRFTQVGPNLAEPGNKAAWYKLEVAKRRLLYTLMRGFRRNTKYWGRVVTAMRAAERSGFFPLPR
jgi:hypothetical protein